jgi:drug/metabolite transporter (DMT)-like permease
VPAVTEAPRPDVRGIAAVAGAASLWGLWSLFLRPTGLPGTVTSPIVLLFVGVFALPLVLRGPPARWDRTTLALLAANTICDAVNVVTFFAALDHTTVAIGVLTHYLAPVFIALAAPRIDGVITEGAAIAAGVATIGLALVLEPWREGGGVGLGALLGAVSAVAYAGNVFVVRRLAPRLGAARTLSYHAILAAALLSPLAVADASAIELADLGWLAGATLVLGTFAGVSFIWGLARIGSARAAVLTFAEPLVAVIVGWVAFGEHLSGWAALGGALVLGAGVAVARARTRPRPVVESG